MRDPFLAALSPAHQQWLAHAIAGMVLADGVVDQAEIEYLQTALDFLPNEQAVDALIEQVREKSPIVLPTLEISEEQASHLLLYLLTIALADGLLSLSEIRFFQQAAQQLRFDSDLVQQVLKWGQRPKHQIAS